MESRKNMEAWIFHVTSLESNKYLFTQHQVPSE